MKTEKIFNFMSTVLFVGIFFFASIVSAEITTYEGVGKCVMSDFDKDEIVKLRAKARAEQAAKEK